MKDYSLYIHIPFCEKKCNYCDFTSYEGQIHLAPPYLTALKNEISSYGAALESKNLRSIYFGGGTPSILNESDLNEILIHAGNNFAFDGKTEISIELNPGTVNLSKLFSYRKGGINRLSIGAQSFDDNMLKALGRIHTSSQAIYTFNSARTAGFNNINLDLIFSLPNQDIIGWSNTLKKAVSLNPEHISTYNLVIEEGTPFHANKKSLTLPNIDEETLMYEDAIETLTNAGYEHYEISNFAKQGYRCKNNMTYWKNEEYIGVGAGATSYLAASRFSNPRKIEEYISQWKTISPSKLPEKLSANSQDRNQVFSETMFLGLRLTNGLDLIRLNKEFGEQVKKHEEDINELAKSGLIELRNARLRLTRKGLFLANEVFEKFV